MRELKKSLILYDNSNCVYKPGDVLSGRVQINFNSNKVVRGIFIEITGKASVYWTESESITDSDGNSTSNSVTYSSKEKYFKEKFYVVGSERNENVKLSSGRHIYPFKYILPSNLPPTFIESTGKITYSVKATLDREWKINKFVETPFIIETLSNIQEHPEPKVYKEIGQLIMEKQFGVIFKSKPLRVIVKIPNSGFYLGQIIPMTFQVDNASDTAIKSISVKLRQVMTFHATSNDRTEEKTLSKNHIPSHFLPKSSRTFSHSLQVPVDVILHDLTNCKIIDIDYEIKVELHTAGLTKNLIGKLPLYPIKPS